jgi:hypothetical protein
MYNGLHCPYCVHSCIATLTEVKANVYCTRATQSRFVDRVSPYELNSDRRSSVPIHIDNKSALILT